jgi:hypothetical protein
MLTNAAIPLTINMISSYLYDLWKGHHDAEVTFESVVECITHTKQEDRREYRRFTFKGSPNEWEALNAADKLKELSEKSSK